MEVIRVLNLRQFDRAVRRFRNTVCKNSTKPTGDTPDGKGGFSVFVATCACLNAADSSCICGHIARFYSEIGPEPCAFWRFDTSLLDPPDPNPAQIKSPVIVEVPSDSGDLCHRNIHCVGNSRLERKFKEHAKEEAMRICADGRSKTFTADRAIELYNQHYDEQRS
jgi:hypothetical protein